MTKLIRLKTALPTEDVPNQSKKLKIFISYSHQDNLPQNPYIDQFIKHISPLKDSGFIEEWYDRKILLGDNLQDKIDFNIEDADIICLFISANFLDSSACKNEKRRALELKKKKGVIVIPIILSSCGWLHDKDISPLLALPTDGRPVSEFEGRDKAWTIICNELKKRIEIEIRIRQLKVNSQFNEFLHDTEMLTKAHSKKENVFLDDIFMPLELDKYDNLKEYTDKISSEDLLPNIFNHQKVLVAGDNQSGKTTLCKKIFTELRSLNFIPVYIHDKKNHFSGIMENKISRALREQYNDIIEDEIDTQRIVPIIDDFHYAHNKEKHIECLSKYTYCIITVDDIYALNINDDSLSSSFITFRIKELKPSLRFNLVKKWMILTDKDVIDDYTTIDRRIRLIDSTLGKNIGKGIMPAYPFFILSTVLTYETFSMPLDHEITSQGYCYQAFIYYYLTKNGVKHDEMDTYNNFLIELAAYMYKEKKEELSHNDFALFMRLYKEKYYLALKEEILLKNLNEIISEDSFKHYSFRYPCFYYFFVAKYLSENIENAEGLDYIKNILNNLHVDENAYIAIFLTHHSKSADIFNEIETVALSLFSKYKPVTLTKEDIKFFDEQADIIVKAVLPPANRTPEKERTERLNIQDEIEESHKNELQAEQDDENESINKDLRRSIKTVEVMGCIIKNRAGSLEKTRLRNIFIKAMDVHLRSLSCFFEIINTEDIQKEMVDLISKQLSQLEDREGSCKKLSEEKKRKLADIIFWNICFFVAFGIIEKITQSLGSDKLNDIVIDACDEINTPASFLVKHGILMKYNKSPQINNIAKRMQQDDFSKIADRVAKLMVVDYCSLNRISFKDKQRIHTLLKIPREKLLPTEYN